jgi:hypothetical protein
MIVEGKCIGYRPVSYTSKKAGEGQVTGVEVCVVSEAASMGSDMVGEAAEKYFLRSENVVSKAAIGPVKVDIQISGGKVRCGGIEFLPVPGGR